MQGLLQALDNRWLARAGALAFLAGSARFAWEKAQGNPADSLVFFLISIGVVLLVFQAGAHQLDRRRTPPTAVKLKRRVRLKPEPSQPPPYLRALQVQTKLKQRRDERLKNDLQDELVAIIDQGNALRGDVFSELPYGPYAHWYDRTRNFIDKTLGGIERQRLEEAQGLDARLRHLGAVRDNPGAWKISVDGAGLRRATEVRRYIDYSQRILLSGSPAGEAQMPQREDRKALAVEIEELAAAIDRAFEERAPEESREVAAIVERGKQLRSQDPKIIRDLAEDQAARPTASLYENSFRDEAVKLFNEAYELGVVPHSARKGFETPTTSAVKGLPNRLRNIAGRLEEFQPPGAAEATSA